jgi:hypothetical protein
VTTRGWRHANLYFSLCRGQRRCGITVASATAIRILKVMRTAYRIEIEEFAPDTAA